MSLSTAALLFAVATAPVQGAERPAPPVTAIVGATVIDGNGGEPLRDATVLVRDKRIAEIGPRASVKTPKGATIVDATGKFVIPGLVDTNVHVSIYSDYETLLRYQPRAADVTREAAQLHLKHGITTIRDSYGALVPLMQVRDAIARGEVIGPRMLVAGNIIGWGGPFSLTWGHRNLPPAYTGPSREVSLSLFQEQMNDEIAHGVGEELFDMTPEGVRVAIDKYLDKGPDFLKIGGTTHWAFPTLLQFSTEVQKVIVEEAHRRGRMVDVHSTTPEGLRMSLEAGIDLIQHPEYLVPAELPDSLVKAIRDRGVICSIQVNRFTGRNWQDHVKVSADAKKALAEREAKTPPHHPKTTAELMRERRELGIDLPIRRRNAMKLIQAGCTVTVGNDSWIEPAPEFRRMPQPDYGKPGIGSLISIEGLVELGMTPMQALTAATKNGALACRGSKDFGTLEAGKLADLVVLEADPLADIANIHRIALVMKDGRVVERAKLPETPIFYSR